MVARWGDERRRRTAGAEWQGEEGASTGRQRGLIDGSVEVQENREVLAGGGGRCG